MIKVKPIPQIPVNLVDRIEYNFEGEKITATLGDISEVYDFTGLPEGRLEFSPEEVETSFPAYPLISAEKDSKGLNIELLHYVGADATEESTTYEWMTVEEYLQIIIEEETLDGFEEYLEK